MALNKAKQTVSSAPVVVFSKSYCGYCNRVKQLFTQLGAAYKTIELDEEIDKVEVLRNISAIEPSVAGDGYEIQSALAEWTGQRTVPNVFIGGKHIGGSDEVLEMHRSGTLTPLLVDAGAIANNSAQLTSI